MFGAPTSTTSSTGFAFGAPATSTAPSGGGFSGFSFGATSTGASTGASAAGGFGGFNFSASAPTSTANTGFSFSGAAPTPAGNTGFSFSGAAPASTANTGFGFSGSAPTSTGNTGFGFASSAPTSTGATVFGLSGAAPTSTGTTGFGFAGSAPTSTGSTGFSFGASKPANGTSTGFGFNLGSQQTTQPVSSTGGFSFGQSPASTADSTAGFSLGGTASGTSAGLGGFKTDTSIAPPSYGGSLLGGLLSAPTSSLAPLASTTTTSTASTGFGSAAPAPTTTSAAAATSLASSSGFNFGFGKTQPTSTSTGLSSGSTVFGAATSSAPSISTALPLSLSTGSAGLAPAQKQMTFRQLEDSINKWTTELEEQEKYFLDQATRVNAWDRIVMENGEKIVQLNKDVEKVKLDQQKLDHELDFVQSQQKELEDILVPLEKAFDNMPPISYQQHADVEREHTYMLAESLDAQLKRMGQDLKEIIERLNATNSKPEPDDPVHQITKILNAHFVSLMWIDRNTGNLMKQMEDISRQMDIEKREQEKNFRLAYS